MAKTSQNSTDFTAISKESYANKNMPPSKARRRAKKRGLKSERAGCLKTSRDRAVKRRTRRERKIEETERRSVFVQPFNNPI